MNHRPLYIVVIVVLALSIWWGYWRAIAPYQSVILRDAGYSVEEVAQFYFVLSIAALIVGYGGAILILLASYHSGKKYELNKTTTIVALIFLIIAIWIGNLVGYAIRQVELPQYPILNLNFIIQTLTSMQGSILWSFIGLLAGNLKTRTQQQE